MPTRITANRKTDFNDLKLNQPEEKFHLKDSKETSKSRPLRFSTPVYNPLTPGTLSVVHPQNSSTKGGFFGLTRKKENGEKKFHGGIDIQADVGTGVLAAEDGVVTSTGFEKKGYGNFIYINHRDGYQTRYAHLSRIDVKAGDLVKKGEFIGESGKTGNASGPEILPHLHFELRKADENGVHQTLDPIDSLTTPRPDRDLRLILDGIGFKEQNYLPKWLS